VRSSNNSGSWARKAFAVGAGVFLLASLAGKAAAQPGTLGTEIVGYYDNSEPSINNGTGAGDNIIRVIDPTGDDMCVMVYVLDNEEELGECCGCFITANELLSFSVEKNLTANWSENSHQQQSGVVYAFASTANNRDCIRPDGTTNDACNRGCDPSLGFAPPTTPIAHINGDITRVLELDSSGPQITETEMSNIGDDDSQEQNLTSQCWFRTRHNNGFGACTCPTEGGPTS
jgi:hypothetical protein